MQLASNCPYCGDDMWVDVYHREEESRSQECESCGYTSVVTISWSPKVTVEATPDEMERKSKEGAYEHPEYP